MTARARNRLAALGALVATAAALLLITTGEARATGVDRCPNQPDVLKVVDGAHKRAQKGWNHRTLKKDPQTIKRVRIQARCAPTKKGRRHVKRQISVARAQYKKAKKKALIRRIYNKITSAPGQARLAVLRQCESTNRYNSPAAPAGAYGMLQGWALSGSYFSSEKLPRKWQRLTDDGPTSPPWQASPHEQDIRASLLYQHHGTGPWECPF